MSEPVLTGRATGPARVVPVLLGLCGLAAVGLAALGADGSWQGVRSVVTAVFLVLGPGWAVAALVPETSAARRAVVTVGVGLAVTVLAGQAMVVSGAWHPVGLLYAVALVVEPVLVVHAVRAS